MLQEALSIYGEFGNVDVTKKFVDIEKHFRYFSDFENEKIYISYDVYLNTRPVDFIDFSNTFDLKNFDLEDYKNWLINTVEKIKELSNV